MPNGVDLIIKIASENNLNLPTNQQLISIKSSMAMPIARNSLSNLSIHSESVPMISNIMPNLKNLNSLKGDHNWSFGSLSASVENGSNRLKMFSLQNSMDASPDLSFGNSIQFRLSTSSIFDPNPNFSLK